MCHRRSGYPVKALAMLGVLVFTAGCWLVPNDRNRIVAGYLPFAGLPTPVRDAWQRQYSGYTVIEVTRIGKTGPDAIYVIGGSRTPDEWVIVSYDAQGNRRDVSVEPIDESRETKP